MSGPPTGALVSWLKPDNSGSTISGYNIYRSTATGTETFLTTVSGENTNKYLDQTVNSSGNYFYRVTAVNGVGEGAFCREVNISGTASGATACAAPYIKVQDAAPAATDPTGQFSIQHVNFGEPFINCNTKQLTAVLKVNTMDPSNTGNAAPPPVSTWEIYFKIPGSANSTGLPQTLFLEYDNTTIPAGAFLSGWIDPATGSDCSTLYLPNDPTNPVTGTVAPDGTITMNLNLSSTVTFATCAATGGTNMTISPSQWTPGTQITNIKGITYQRAGGLITGVKVTKAQTTGDGTYTTIGNVNGCNLAIPLAVLSAAPQSGNAPLSVTFSGSASSEPSNSCATINSFTLDFGDGSAPVTQSTPTFNHTYNNPGDYPARLTVSDTVGHVSVNQALAVIQVGSVTPPPLSGVVSRKTHGTLTPPGDLPLNLDTSTAATIEPRSGGIPSGNHTLVFSFVNTLSAVSSVSASATTSSGTGAVTATGSIGTDTHQYIVSLTGVPNASHVNVILHGATDSVLNSGDVGPVRMDVLFGDVNSSKRTDAGDVTAVRNRTVSIPDTTNPASFRYDVNTSGRIDAGDVTATRNATVTVLPP